MLLGQGCFDNQQTGYPVQVFEQINKIATKAWKSPPNKGEVSGNLTKILQGPIEPFSDFVARLVEAAGKIFGDPDTAMPLIKQLVYEQCTKECRAAITPYKNRGLEAWTKVCRELGGPLMNAGLAAAILQLSKKKGEVLGLVFGVVSQDTLKGNVLKDEIQLTQEICRDNGNQDYAPHAKREGIGRMIVTQSKIFMDNPLVKNIAEPIQKQTAGAPDPRAHKYMGQ